jgi:hypothetical protein
LRVDELVELPFEPVESLVDLFESLVDLFESLVDLFESLVDLFESPVDLFESFEPLPDFRGQPAECELRVLALFQQRSLNLVEAPLQLLVHRSAVRESTIVHDDDRTEHGVCRRAGGEFACAFSRTSSARGSTSRKLQLLEKRAVDESAIGEDTNQRVSRPPTASTEKV